MNEKLRFPFFTFLLTALYTLKGMIEHRLKQTLTNRKCVCLNKKRSLWGLLPEAFKWFPLNVWSPEENLKCHYEISIGCFIICAHFSCGSSLDDIYTPLRPIKCFIKPQNSITPFFITERFVFIVWHISVSRATGEEVVSDPAPPSCEAERYPGWKMQAR